VNEQPLEASREPMPIRSSGLRESLVVVRGVAGGIVGGVLGFFLVGWLKGQGMYGMMIPGALIGLGAALAARGRSLVLGVICALAAVVFGFVIEWAVFPFLKDKSFAFFLAHLHDLKPMTMIMIGLGAVFAFWLGQGR
jgi:hypothetical protein